MRVGRTQHVSPLSGCLSPLSPAPPFQPVPVKFSAVNRVATDTEACALERNNFNRVWQMRLPGHGVGKRVKRGRRKEARVGRTKGGDYLCPQRIAQTDGTRAGGPAS